MSSKWIECVTRDGVVASVNVDQITFVKDTPEGSIIYFGNKDHYVRSQESRSEIIRLIDGASG